MSAAASGGEMRGSRRVRSLLRWMVFGRERGLRAKLRALWSRETPRAAEARTAAEPAPAPVPQMEGWTRLVAVDELQPGDVVEVIAGDRALALARTEEGFFAVDNTCPHAGGPLGDGELAGCELTCPWHGWSFDVRDGSCRVDPQLRVAVHPIRVEAGAVWVADPPTA